ncbi:MAG TPA: chemotaxis-specific protein-glutamate methyltransferase CheB [Gemmatimonadales bacterium]|nr:chemotaxis-specific protein-glutamate methyltransferase CheB [Gemmatimonadales bacterium]
MIRVVVAEDSLTVRELLVEILERDPDIKVVGQAKNGLEAVELTERLQPDLVTMDVHMPLMDGLEATKEIMVRSPVPIVIVSSSASGRDVGLALNAVRAGALMVVSKPDDPGSPAFDGRQSQFLAMVKAMSDVKVVRRWARRPHAPRESPPRRRARSGGLRAVAVAASTGGPALLQYILRLLPREFPVPILVVQHIARGFISGLADWLNEGCDLRVKVAEHGEVLSGRTVFLAPDDFHLGVGAGGTVELSRNPPIGGFRPSATHLFEAAARAYGPGVVAVVLSGMGSDGAAGLAAIKSAGGTVIAQDEASSVVYGMPREAMATGLVDEQLSVAEIAARFEELAAGSGAGPGGESARR